MRLTRYSDYGLRVLMFAALEGEATIGEISRRYGISRNHLMKVVHHLGALGYLETVRGKGGGLRLARPAARIRVGEVVRAMEEDFTLVECFAPASSGCRIAAACVLREALGDALAAFFAELDRYTLADLVAPKARLVRLLQAGASPR